MFNWFRPHCPVDPYEEAWLEKRFDWLIETFGIERLRDAPIVLPSPEWFPDAYAGSDEDVTRIFDRVCAYMGLSPCRFTLEFMEGQPEIHGRKPLGAYEHADRETIHLNRSQVHDPVSLVSTISHELAHALLLGDGRLSAVASDHEPLTDLTTVFLGLGLFGANSVMRYSQHYGGQYHYWQILRKGYLHERQFAYALALYAWLRGEPRPDWMNHLRKNVKSVFQAAIKYFQKSTERVVDFERWDAVPNATLPPLQRCLHAIGSSHSARRVGGLWDMRVMGESVRSHLTAAAEALADSHAAVRLEAAHTLALHHALARDTPIVETVIERFLWEDDPPTLCMLGTAAVRMGAAPDQLMDRFAEMLRLDDPWIWGEVARLVGEMGTADVTIIQRLIELLQDQESVAAEVMVALGKLGTAAAEAVPELVAMLEADSCLLRLEAVEALGNISQADANGVAALIKALGAPATDLRAEAALALARLGPSAVQAIPRLEQRLNSRDTDTRRMAALALARIDGRMEPALQALVEMLPPPFTAGPALRTPAWAEAPWLEALRAVKHHVELLGSAAVSHLTEWLFADSVPRQCFAAWALGVLGPEAIRETAPLEQTLHNRNGDPLLRLLCGMALSRIPAARSTAIPGCMQLLCDVRGAAMRSHPQGHDLFPMDFTKPTTVYSAAALCELYTFNAISYLPEESLPRLITAVKDNEDRMTPTWIELAAVILGDEENPRPRELLRQELRDAELGKRALLDEISKRGKIHAGILHKLDMMQRPIPWTLDDKPIGHRRSDDERIDGLNDWVIYAMTALHGDGSVTTHWQV